jgi:hypothetical protein
MQEWGFVFHIPPWEVRAVDVMEKSLRAGRHQRGKVLRLSAAAFLMAPDPITMTEADCLRWPLQAAWMLVANSAYRL